MIIISHRGNLEGPDPMTENTLIQAKKCLSRGFNIELDIWEREGKLYLGHDGPGEEEVPLEMIHTAGIWWHCKNIGAMRMMIYSDSNFFFHYGDDVALTGFGYLWTYPGRELTAHSIAVLPETQLDWNINKAFGICTDFPYRYSTL